MKRKVLIPIIVFSSLFFLGNGCGKRTYYQLISYDSTLPLIYEVKRDTTTVNSFAGIDFMNYDGHNDGERINILRLSYQNSTTKKFSVTNLGFQLIAGNYKVNGIDKKYTLDSVYDGNKFGIGGRVNLSGGLNFNIKGFRMGLGIEPSLSFDFGNFYSFRIDAAKKGVINSDGGFINLYLNLFPYLSIPIGNGKLINLQTNIGMPGFFSPILSLQMDDYIFWACYNKARINAGLSINSDLIKSAF